jgi:hypothetical protein
MPDLKYLMDQAVAGVSPSPQLAAHAIREHGRRQRRRRIAAGVVSAAVAVAAVLFWSVGSTSRSGDSRLVPVTGTTAPSGPPRYVATGLVIFDPKHAQGTRLCVGVVAQSLPPSCSGILLRGVDIHQLPGVRTVEGVTFTETDVQVIAKYANGVLTATERPKLAPPQAFLREPASVDLPCPAPEAGWTSQKFDSRDAAVLFAYGTAHPDTFGGLWTTHNQQIGVVTTTGDLAMARRDIRRTYSGNLCVAKAKFTDKSLRAASARLGTQMAAFWDRLEISTTTVNVYESRIDIWVTIDNAAVEHYLAANFPAGLVKVHAYLVPLS